jgi:hypothetical protein
MHIIQKGKKRTYIKNLQVLIFLLYKQLFIELLDEVHLLVTVQQMIKGFQH